MVFNLFGGERKRIVDLVAAARAGDTDKVRVLLSMGVDINGVEPDSGDTALMAAIGEGHRTTIEYLLSQNPDLTKEDPNGIFALMAAAVSRRDPELVGLLLAAGAPVDQTPSKGDYLGITAAHLCAAIAENACLERLLAAGASATRPRPDGSTPLHTAAMGGDEQTVSLLTNAGADVSRPNDAARTPLHDCAITGNAKAAAALIQAGAQVDPIDAEGCTPLLHATMKNHIDVASLLLDYGADPDTVAQTDDTPLYPLFSAAMNGHEEIVRLLLEKGADVLREFQGLASALEVAEHRGHEAIAEMISDAIREKKPDDDEDDLDRSVDEELARLAELINHPLIKPQLPQRLYQAATDDLDAYEKGGLEAVSKQLREHLSRLVEQLEAKLSNNENQHPAFTAAQSGSVTETLSAVKAGFDINTKNADAMTLLMIAASNGHDRLAGSLLDHGADIAATCEKESDLDAMMMACAAGHTAVVRLLLDRGMGVNTHYAPGSSRGRVGGQTALSFAANRGQIDVVRLLLERGADTEIVADSGYTALMWALVNGSSEEAAEVLLDAGANPDPGTRPIESFEAARTTPLILAASNGLTCATLRLIAAGVDLNAQDASGWTALKHASRNGADDIVSALIAAGADVDLADEEGWTPLIAAASRAAWSTMDLLISAGADVNHKGDGGNTALRQVFDRRMLRHTMVVLAALADRDLSEEQIEGYVSAYQQLEKLLQAGANPNVTHEDDSDRNLLDAALSQSDAPVCDLLRRYGAEPTEQ